MRRRSRTSGLMALLLAALACPLSLGWSVFSFRTVEVACTRAGEQVDCRTAERVGPYTVFEAQAADIRIARAMTNADNGPSGVIAETEAGVLVPLTSSVLGEDQIRAIAGRLHQWIFNEPASGSLAFTQPASLPNLLLGAGIALVATLWALVSLLGLLRPRRRQSAPPAGGRLSI